MEVYIDRETAIKKLTQLEADNPDFTMADVKMALMGVTLADVRKIIYSKDISETHIGHCEFKCSVCSAWVGCVEGGPMDGGYFNYCPNCGAKMNIAMEQAPIKYIPHWITHGENQDVFECSECHEEIWDEKTPYCPYCGVKMEVDNEID